ncbi:MAG: hypothetical protein AAF391_04845, partial [Bacteroidota bacterium]
MRICLFVIILMWVYHLPGQNLIENGSFEEGDCPIQHSIKPYHFKVDKWIVPDGSTPDYFNSCSEKDAGTPKNWAGSQYPVDGEAYVGIYLRKGRYQENLGIKLTEDMQKGEIYEGSFFVANVSNAAHLAYEISVLFSKEPILLNHLKNYDFRQIRFRIPKPKNYSDYSWNEISFRYQAKGGEKYFYVGPLKLPNAQGIENYYRIIKEPMLNNAMYVFLDNFILIHQEQKQVATEEPEFVLEKKIDPLEIYFDFDEFYLPDGSGVLLDSIVGVAVKEDLYLLVTGST